MSTIQIDYRIVVQNLAWGGTYDNPVGMGHPNIQVYRDGSPEGGVHSSDEAVVVNRGDRINITCTDSLGRRNVTIAPTRFLAGHWTPPGGTAQPCTVAMMTNVTTKPISEPQFGVTMGTLSQLSYKPQSSNWEQDTPNFRVYMGNSVNVGNESEIVHGRTITIPNIEFDAESLPGTLWYGLQFAVMMDDVDRGHLWFDPKIRIV